MFSRVLLLAAIRMTSGSRSRSLSVVRSGSRLGLNTFSVPWTRSFTTEITQVDEGQHKKAFNSVFMEWSHTPANRTFTLDQRKYNISRKEDKTQKQFLQILELHERRRRVLVPVEEADHFLQQLEGAVESAKAQQEFECEISFTLCSTPASVRLVVSPDGGLLKIEELLDGTRTNMILVDSHGFSRFTSAVKQVLSKDESRSEPTTFEPRKTTPAPSVLETISFDVQRRHYDVTLSELDNKRNVKILERSANGRTHYITLNVDETAILKENIEALVEEANAPDFTSSSCSIIVTPDGQLRVDLLKNDKGLMFKFRLGKGMIIMDNEGSADLINALNTVINKE